MLLTTLRKAVDFVLWALSLLLGAVVVMAWATIAMAVIVLLVESATGSFEIVGVVAFVAVTIAGITATTVAVRKAEQQRRKTMETEKERQAARAEAERQREEASAPQMGEDASTDLADSTTPAPETAEEKKEKRLLQSREGRIKGLKDLLWTAKPGMPLPFGLKSIDEVALELRKLQATVDAGPTIDKVWQGTGGAPKPGRNWIRKTWPHEARDFTPWIAEHLELVSACTGWDLRLEGTEVYAAGGRVDVVARENKKKSKVVIENQLDSADFEHWRQLVFYGDTLNARIRIWIAADFSPNIRRDVRYQNRQNESRSDGAIYYLLKLRPDQISPISLVEGPRIS